MDLCMDLPPGFRFHPTDEEIITHYLSPKVVNPSFSARAVGEVDLNKCEPWDLPSKAKMGEKEWYFFCQRDRKYPTGMRTNRATEAGYWKATGKDKEIYRGKGILVGMKKTLVFYTGRAPKGEKSNWVMHEYRLEGKSAYNAAFPKPAKDEWVVCRVFHKSSGVKRSPMPIARMSSFGDLLDSPNLPPLTDSAPYNYNSSKPSSSAYLTNDIDDAFDFKGILSGTTSMPTSNFFSSFDDITAGFSNFNQIMNPAGSTPNHFHHQMGQTSQFMQPAAGYLNKTEQLPNHSMLSDDTGLSTDRNTEISSVVSRHDIGSCASYGDIDVPSAGTGPAMDLDNMWKC